MEAEVTGWIGQFMSEAPTAAALIAMAWMFLRDRKARDDVLAKAMKEQSTAITELRIFLAANRVTPIPFPDQRETKR